MVDKASFEIKSFDDWDEYKGFPEGSGRSEKLWLQSKDGKIGLFKFPKYDPETLTITTEHVSEHLASLIGKDLGVQTADVDLGTYKNRIGSISYLVNKENEAVVEGIQFLLKNYPNYDKDNLIDKESGGHYCIDYILSVFADSKWKEFVLKMMLFDFLIGNSDRHQNNWAVLLGYEEEESVLYRRLCPLYDNGSSLCCYINGSRIDDYLGRDKNRFSSLVDSKSRSIIRIHPEDANKPTHKEVLMYLMKEYPETCTYAREMLNKFTSEKVTEYLNYYPEVVLPDKKRELIKRFLFGKCEILSMVLSEVV